MKENIFLWHGESFLIKEKKDFWKKSFFEKHGEINYEELDINSAKFSEILSAITAPPFLSEKRLVVLKGIPHSTKDKKLDDLDFEKLQKALETNEESTLVVFASGKPDKRSKIFKFLAKEFKTEEFKHPDKELFSWVKDFAKRKNYKISDENLELFLSLVSTNLFLISNELKKINSYKNGEEILKKDIENLIQNTSEVNIFKITNLLSSGKKIESLKELQNLIRAGEDLVHIFNLIVRQIRLLIGAFELKEKSSSEIAKELKLAPFAASALKKQVGNFNLEKLLFLHKKLYETDKKIKTGVIRLDTKGNKALALELEKEIILAC